MAWCSASTTTTLSNSASASSLAAACPTYSGDIEVGEDVEGDMTMDGLETLEGSLKMFSVEQLSSFSSDSLQSITDTLSLEGLTILATFDAPSLTTIGQLELLALPNQQSLSFFQSLERLQTLEISNTQISELEGFGISTIDEITIENNPYLTSINLQPSNLTGSLSIRGNGPDTRVSLPQITFAQNLTFSNCSEVLLPTLRRINGSLELTYNSMSSFSGASQLQSVDGTLSMEENYNMQNVSLPELRSVAGGLKIRNNTLLNEIGPLYSLELLGGAIDLEGSFSRISFPSLDEVRGALEINTTADMSCSEFNDLYTDRKIRGFYSCNTGSDVANTTTLAAVTSSNQNNTGSTASASASPTSSSTSATDTNSTALGVGIGVGIGGALILAALLYFLWWRPRRRKRRQTSDSSEHAPIAEKDGNEIDRAAMLDTDVQKHELEQPMVEMPLGGEAQELPAKHGQVELGRSSSMMGAPEGVEQRHEMPAEEVACKQDGVK